MTPTRYRPIRGTGSAIVAGHPLAAAAGARILDRGGNAVDAAIAAAASAVVRPHMCGVAGDGFLLLYDAASRTVRALNAGGPAPRALTPQHFPRGMPDRGALLSTVPGILDGWAQALQRFGTMAWSDVLQPAIELAARGFPMYESLAACGSATRATRTSRCIASSRRSDSVKSAGRCSGVLLLRRRGNGRVIPPPSRSWTRAGTRSR